MLNCRIWWPKSLSSPCTSSSSSGIILFGWFLPSSPHCSLDIVVAPIHASSSTTQPEDLQDLLHSTNQSMSRFLQEKATFSILGQCSTSHNPHGFLDEYRRSSLINNANWIELFYQSLPCPCRRTPKLHHLHQGGHLLPTSDVHFQVIIYDPPAYGSHHFSLKSWGSSEQVTEHHKTPKWIDKLTQSHPLPDMDTVIFAVNSATSAKIFFEGPKSCFHHLSLVSGLVSMTCHLAAVFLASFFTLIYIILQLFRRLILFGSHASLCRVIKKVFNLTWKNAYVRCCQFLYWPVHLQDRGIRSQSNMEYAHRAALHKHSMWSSVIVDVLLGNVFGFALLLHIDTVFPWVVNLTSDITNSWLRSGCVWLMGNPAGFKLNTELAGILGMTSLNAIQIWSTLWVYLGVFVRYFIKGLALSGIISGLTIPAALIVDTIMLATSHVSTLHWLISLLYSHQIKALAALWRLFRGRKWNPLRQRFDSYEYTVKQHVVGSLLFTPLLLLLPTTSVFYVFFTILNTTICFICILIEIIILLLHATPYHEIFLWLVRPGRFPSGIWFDIVSSQSSNARGFPVSSQSSNARGSPVSSQSSNARGSPVDGCVNEDMLSKTSQRRNLEEEYNGGSHFLLLFLQTNFSSIGQIILPHYTAVFHEFSLFSNLTSACGFLTGSRIQAVLPTSIPSTMPWMHITYKDYWCLCFGSVISCLGRA